MFEGQFAVELDIQTDADIRILDTRQRSRLREVVACDRRIVRGPTVAFRRTPDGTDEIEAPICARRIIGEVPEGNGHLGDPSVGDHARTDKPYRVPSR
jgi:hypothetical protein